MGDKKIKNNLYNIIFSIFIMLFIVLLVIFNNNKENSTIDGNRLLALSYSDEIKINYSNYLESRELYREKFRELKISNENLGNFYIAIDLGYRDINDSIEMIFDKIRNIDSDLTKEKKLEILSMIGSISRFDSEVINILKEEIYNIYGIKIDNEDISNIIDLTKKIKTDKGLINIRLESHIKNAQKELESKNKEFSNYIKRQIIRSNPQISKEDLDRITKELIDKFEKINNPETINKDLIEFVKDAKNDYGVDLDIKIISENKKDIIELESYIDKIETEILKENGEISDDEYQDIINSINDYINEANKNNDIIQNMDSNQINDLIENNADYNEIEQNVIEDLLNQDIEDIINVDDIIDNEIINEDNLISGKTPIAYIENLKGQVLFTNLAGSTGHASINQLLYEGYKIQTINPGSFASIIFEDDSVLRLDENTSIEIKNKSGNDIIVKNNKGSIWARVLKIFDNNQSFIIESDNISAAIRGTAVLFEKLNSGRNNIYVVDSSSPQASVIVNNGSRSIELEKRQKSTYYNGNLEDSSSYQRDFSNNFIKQNTRDDIMYLGVLLNDRERLFDNNPIGIGRFDNNFLEKVQNEIIESIPYGPTNIERFFNNEEVKNYIAIDISDDINLDNIYELILKDNIVDNIKKIIDEEGDIKDKLIDSFLNLDFENIKENSGNLRDVNTKFSLGIDKQIAQEVKENPEKIEDIQRDLEDIIQDFGLDEVALIKKEIEKIIKDIRNNKDKYIEKQPKDDKYEFTIIKNNISIDNIDDIISIKFDNKGTSKTIDRPKYNENYKNVSIKIIIQNNDGSITDETSVNYTITKKEPTDKEKVEEYKQALKRVIDGANYINDKIPKVTKANISNSLSDKSFINNIQVSWNKGNINGDDWKLERPLFKSPIKVQATIKLNDIVEDFEKEINIIKDCKWGDEYHVLHDEKANFYKIPEKEYNKNDDAPSYLEIYCNNGVKTATRKRNVFPIQIENINKITDSLIEDYMYRWQD